MRYAHKRIAECCLLALSLGVGYVLTAGGQTGDNAGPATEAVGVVGPRIAVIDVAQVFEQSLRWADVLRERRDLMSQMERSLEARQKQVRVFQNEYQNLAPGSDTAETARENYMKALEDFETSRQEYQAQVSDQITRSLRGMLGDVSKVVADYARENGIDLVLKRWNLESAPTSDIQVQEIMAAMDVLYAADRLDITGAIVERLNSSYPREIEEK